MNDQPLKEKAEKFFLQGKWAKALGAFLRLSEQAPQDFRLRLKIAETLLRLERQEEAQIIFRQVADLYTKDGQLHKAIAIHQRLLDLDRDDREAQAKVALLFERQKQPAPTPTVMGKDEIDQTVETICQDQVMEQVRDFRERLRQALTRSDFPVGLEYALKLWRLEPANLENRLAIARVLQSLKRSREASELYFHCCNELLLQANVLRAIFLQTHIDETLLPIKRLELQKKISIVLGKAGEQRAKNKNHPLWNRIPQFLQRKEIMDHILEDVLIDPIDLGKINPLPILSDLPRKECEALLHVLKPQTFAKGELVFPMHTAADSFYWITHGEVGLYPQTGDHLSTQASPGNVLGETELLGVFGFLFDGRRAQTAIALSEVELLELTRRDFEQLTSAHESIREVFDQLYRQVVLTPHLAIHPLFTAFTAEELKQIAHLFQTERHPNHSFALAEGSTVEKCIYIRDGKIDIFWGKMFDQEPLQNLARGNLFADLEWVTASLSPYSYRSNGTVTLLTLKKSALTVEQQKMLHQPALLKELLQNRNLLPAQNLILLSEETAHKLVIS